jgi:hypothetical protein
VGVTETEFNKLCWGVVIGTLVVSLLVLAFMPPRPSIGGEKITGIRCSERSAIVMDPDDGPVCVEMDHER